MLTAVGRATARRVAASRSIARTTSLPIRPAKPALPFETVRSFSVSQWSRMAASSGENNSDSGTTKKTSTKKTTKSSTGTDKSKTKKTKTTVAKKKKKPAAKKKPAGRPRVALTPEQKEKKRINELTKVSLVNKEPAFQPDRSWSVFVSEKMGKLGTVPFADKIKELKSAWDALPGSDKQHYELKGAANFEENKVIQKEWVLSHSVEEIYLANLARVQLAKLTNKKRVYKITDDRMPKRPAMPYARFLQSRLNSYGGSDIKDAFKTSAQEWKNLRDAEKKPFEDAYAEDLKGYHEKFDPIKERSRDLQKARKALGKPTTTASA